MTNPTAALHPSTTPPATPKPWLAQLPDDPSRSPPSSVRADAAVLERNLAALRRGSGVTAALVQGARARDDLRFSVADDGALTADAPAAGGAPGRTAALCSRRRPLEEAAALIEPVDVAGSAVFIVGGFGVGHHVAELARRVGRTGLIVVFEPDAGLLRAVLERVDHSAWLSGANVAVLTNPDDSAAMAAAINGIEPLLALGVQLIEHPPSLARLGGGDEQGPAARFRRNLLTVIDAVKMTLVTSLVQVGVTLRNLLQNLDRYAEGPGIDDLRGVLAADGVPAIVVSAGPSLERTIETLARAGDSLRGRAVIIAVQTALKPLLARGIRPHFVTALDHSELGQRFYEGLSAADVEGVTLVIDPKVNAAVPAAFPGTIRCIGNRHLDLLLGGRLNGIDHPGRPPVAAAPPPSPAQARSPKGELPAGATVAHMAYYLARHLGCGTVALTGQDLGFTDHQYYSGGAAIHRVWANELNHFNSLESLEWQRIARMGRQLRPAMDVLGRPVYTDAQMSTYLVQFEREFAADAARGLRTIDATEGGVRKRHTEPMDLAVFLDLCADRAIPELAGRLGGSGGAGVHAAAADRRRVVERLREVRSQVWTIAESSRSAGDLLSEMSGRHGDQTRVNTLIREVYGLRDRVTALEPGFTLVQALDQSGGLNRVKADRALQLTRDLAPLERQRREIERDAANVRSLAESANELGGMLDHAIRVLEGRAEKITRDPLPAERLNRGAAKAAVAEAGGTGGRGRPRAVGVLPLALAGREPGPADGKRLAAMLARLGGSRQIDGVVVVTDDGAAAQRVLQWAVGGGGGPPVIVAVEPGALSGSARLAAIRAARRAAGADGGAGWRAGSGLANLTCFDELLEPAAIEAALSASDAGAAVLIDPAWSAIEPGLVDAVAARWRENPAINRLTFTQAPPGIAPCCIDRALVRELVRAEQAAGPFATIGGLVGYLPTAPSADLIGTPVCVAVPPEVRDSAAERRADGAARPAAPVNLLFELTGAGAPVIGLLAESLRRGAADGRAAGDDLGVDRLGEIVRSAARLAREAGLAAPEISVTLGLGPAYGDPLASGRLCEAVRVVREAGAASVHVRTRLLAPAAVIDRVLESAPDVISVDLLAESVGLHERMTGLLGPGALALARGNLDRLLSSRAAACGRPGATLLLALPWVVVRMTKCDAAYAELESFYNRWALTTGCVAIDPLPSGGPLGRAHRGHDSRIKPLPTPESAWRREARSTLSVLSDGRVLARPRPDLPDPQRAPLGGAAAEDLAGELAGDLSRDALAEVWKHALRLRGVSDAAGAGGAA